jgi:hypothetical protein|tara:strand:+ start:22 stop:558 length:537 start_codon:yes stop_codon:yes gene_type:complete
MAEAFSNKLTRAAGIVSTSSSGAVGILTNLITGISTVDVAVNDLVDNSQFLTGTKVSSVGASQVVCDRDSTNTSSVTSQSVKFLGPTTAYTSTGTKSILVGGTFANNTTNSVNLTVQVFDNSASSEVGIAAKIPVPSGSSFVITDAGKTVLESSDEIRVYCDSANAIDATLSILTGVS